MVKASPLQVHLTGLAGCVRGVLYIKLRVQTKRQSLKRGLGRIAYRKNYGMYECTWWLLSWPSNWKSFDYTV